MFLRRIQHRLIFLFVILVVAILIISGLTLHWTIRQSLEAELGRKLIAVANAASVLFGEEELGFLLQGVGTRTQQRMRQRLLELRNMTGVRGIYFFNLDGQSLLDTKVSIHPGTSYFNLRFYSSEIGEIRNKQSIHSVLFTGIDGQPAMTGYAPLLFNDGVAGGVAVDGSVTFLGAINRLRNRLYLIGTLCALGAIILGFILARSITQPLGKLVKASEKIGRGNYNEPIPPLSKDEVGRLSETMEEMRKGILERERELKAMVAGVAHEIRNPLGGIELFTGLLSDEVEQDREAKMHVERISKEVTQLKGIVDSFLTFARPQEPNKENCRVSEIISDVTSLVEDQMKKQQIALSLPNDTNNIMAWADPKHLKRIVLNLMQNAILAMPEGGKIEILWKETGDSIILILKDTGSGIPQELHEKVFIPFFTTREKGTGLGLSIVKGLVEANEGSIELVQSDKNGSEFEIRLKQYTK